MKQMPMICEFSGYSDRGADARRRTRALYNHPVGSAIDYFVINLKDSPDSIDRGTSGHLRHKLKIKVGGNEEAIKNRAVSELIDLEWMFKILKDRHQEPAGRPISRVAKQLNAPDTVIESELGIGVRTPGGVWDWLGWERSELKNLGRDLTNRDVRLL